MMKRIFSALIVTAILTACGGGNAEVEKLKAELDSLKSADQNKAQEIDQYIADFNDIQSNLSEIKRKEGIIGNETAAGGELSESSKAKIEEDIALIQQLMEENKAKIATLNKKVRKGDLKMKEFEKMIASLQKTVEEKDAEIESLKTQLAGLNIQIAAISKSYDSLAIDNNEKQSTIEAQTTDLNTAFYAVGTFKELKDANVITPGGAFNAKSGAKLSADLNQDYFTKVDIRNVKEVKLNAKKAKLATTHPAGTYSIEGGKGAEKLIIKDTKKFWSASKYCVVITE